jgi:hypothetical protein
MGTSNVIIGPSNVIMGPWHVNKGIVDRAM